MGLGHGLGAAIAAQAALATAKDYRDKAPAEIIERAHGSLRSTRGAAMPVAEINLRAKIVCYCGVGNISGAIVPNEQMRHLVSHNGIVQQEMRKITEFKYPWNGESHPSLFGRTSHRCEVVSKVVLLSGRVLFVSGEIVH